jgi:hypothetical protein
MGEGELKSASDCPRAFIAGWKLSMPARAMGAFAQHSSAMHIAMATLRRAVGKAFARMRALYKGFCDNEVF